MLKARAQWAVYAMGTSVMPLIAIANDAPADGGPVGKLVDLAIRGVGSLLGLAITGFIFSMAKSRGFALDEAKKEAIRAAVKKAIDYAEEWASSRIKAGDLKATGQQKLDVATQRILEKVPGITPEEAHKLVHEELREMGYGAVNAMGGVVGAVANDEGNPVPANKAS